MNILDTPPKNGMTFNHRGTPIDPELRPLWRISIVSLILLNLCWGSKANSKKIQALYSLIASEKKRNAYSSSVAGESEDSIINIRFDPLVDRAIDMGVGEKVFLLDDAKSIKLDEKGLIFAKRIDKEKGIFVSEKEFMKKFGKSHFVDKKIDSLIAGDLV